jgi:hypothetical protein
MEDGDDDWFGESCLGYRFCRCRFQIPIPNRFRHGCEVTNKVNGVHMTISSDVSSYGSLSSPSGPSRSPLMNILFERLTSIYAQIVNNNIKKV